MSAISKALTEIRYRVPAQVLKIAFQQNAANWRAAPLSLDQEIMNQVIRPRVLMDANLVGGQQVIVPLDGITPEVIDNFTLVYEIPPQRISDQAIISVLSVSYMPYITGSMMNSGTGYANPQNVNDLSMATMKLADSHSSIPHISTAHVELVGRNKIMIRDTVRVTGNYQLRCIVANDENLSNINPRSWRDFAEMCTLAVKSYIYNKLLVQMDQAFLVGGQELGAVKAYVEGLSDSEEMYQTFVREVWQQTATMNDTLTHTRYIRSLISPGL